MIYTYTRLNNQINMQMYSLFIHMAFKSMIWSGSFHFDHHCSNCTKYLLYLDYLFFMSDCWTILELRWISFRLDRHRAAVSFYGINFSNDIW